MKKIVVLMLILLVPVMVFSQVKLTIDNKEYTQGTVTIITQPSTPVPVPIPIPTPVPIPTPTPIPIPIPADAQVLSWGLTNYMTQGVTGQKRTYIIRVVQGKTYGSVYFTSVDPSTSFTYRFIPIPGYLYLGRSEIKGNIFYGILELPFIPSYFTPEISDGYIPAGDNVLELNFIDNGRILITTSIY